MQTSVENAFLASIVLSTLSVSSLLLALPVFLGEMESLKTTVYHEMEEFQLSADQIWDEIIHPDFRDKREEQVYKVKMGAKKDKKHHLRMPHLPIRTIDSTKVSLERMRVRKMPLVVDHDTKDDKYKRKAWGKRVFLSVQGSTTQRLHGQHTVEQKPGRGLFTDAELIGKRGSKKVSKTKKVKMQICQAIPDKRCPSGPPGPPGPDGRHGVDGLPGIPGVNGQHAGLPVRSRRVPRSNPCYVCPQGAPGPKGSTGPIGENGAEGVAGKDAYLNLDGPPGPPGYQGKPGVGGPPGAPGFPGRSTKKWICPQGEKGPVGPPGERGIPGVPGADGQFGLAGVAGKMGKIGQKGHAGSEGERGAPGISGRHGYLDPYCKCPKRSNGVRGNFTLPHAGAYVNPAALNAYPKDLDFD